MRSSQSLALKGIDIFRFFETFQQISQFQFILILLLRLVLERAVQILGRLKIGRLKGDREIRL